MALKIDEVFVEAAREEPYRAIFAIEADIDERAAEDTGWTDSDHDFLMRAYALVRAMLRDDILPDVGAGMPLPAVDGSVNSDCNDITAFIKSIADRCKRRATKDRLESLEAAMSRALGTGFAYEFSQGDLARIQELIGELRKLVSESDHFEEDHQRRLLMRLEKLQAELHKRVSDLDRFWGLLGDAGVAAGKFGKDAKPFFDRIKEIAGITWRTQARSEELSTDAPFPLLQDLSKSSEDPTDSE